jgi:glycosyltransferase involved in cell wall biosynthesis
MRVLTLTYEYPPIGGGGGVVAAALNKQLVANGHVIDVVTSAMPGLPRQESVSGAQVYRSSCFRRHRHFTTALELSSTLLPAYRVAAKLIQQRPPDLIHTHFALPSGIIARELSARYGIPYVLTLHGSDIPHYNPDRFGVLHRLVAPVWRRTMRGAAAITSPSQFLGNLMQESVSLPYKIIPNGYTPEEEASATPLPKRNLVLVVARLFPRKGVQHFIDSVASMTSDWEFVIAGDGPYMPALKEQASRVGAKVRFVGFIDKVTLRGLYEEARILVFPSIRENFPMVLLEAMDAGCAVITTDAEGCAEVVGDAGVVFKKGNTGELRNSLMALMQDPQRCASLSRVERPSGRNRIVGSTSPLSIKSFFSQSHTTRRSRDRSRGVCRRPRRRRRSPRPRYLSHWSIPLPTLNAALC